MFELMPFGTIRNNPFHELDKLEKQLFGDFGSDFSQFRTDIIEKPDKYVLKADLPGFEKKDIKVDLKGDTLTITAQHDESKEDHHGNYLRRERRSGSYTRSFSVAGIQADGIDAEYKSGVLTVTLPKEPTITPPSHQIEIR